MEQKEEEFTQAISNGIELKKENGQQQECTHIKKDEYSPREWKMEQTEEEKSGQVRLKETTERLQKEQSKHRENKRRNLHEKEECKREEKNGKEWWNQVEITLGKYRCIGKQTTNVKDTLTMGNKEISIGNMNKENFDEAKNGDTVQYA